MNLQTEAKVLQRAATEKSIKIQYSFADSKALNPKEFHDSA